MGNQSSCLLPGSRASTAVLMGPRGNVRRVAVPAGAAELMLEAPGHVVARAEDLHRTRRVLGMRADEQLRPGEAYVLLPSCLLGSRVSDRQMAVILKVVPGKREKRRGECGSVGRVFPEVAGAGGKEEAAGDREGKGVAGFSCQRTGCCRQWRPLLDTIQESPARR